MEHALNKAPRLPGPQQDTGPGFALALLMHALLFGGLSLVVQWKTQDPPPATAELWAALPEPSAVPAPTPPAPVVEPPAPPPPPKQELLKRDADIVTKIEKKAEPKKEEKTEDKKKAEEKKQQDAERKKQEDAKEAKQLEAQREAIRKAEAARMAAQAGEPGPSTAHNSRGRDDAGYDALIKACIRPYIVFAVPEGTSPSVHASFRLDVLPTGELASVRLIKPSGLPGYDDAAERAIRRCDPIPRRKDGTVERNLEIKMSPVEAG